MYDGAVVEVTGFLVAELVLVLVAWLEPMYNGAFGRSPVLARAVKSLVIAIVPVLEGSVAV